jgi:hypothetical protein
MGYTPSVDASHLLRLICHVPRMREMSVTEQRYKAVLAVPDVDDHSVDFVVRSANRKFI